MNNTIFYIIFGVILMSTYVLPKYIYKNFNYDDLWVGIPHNWFNYTWMIFAAISFIIFYVILIDKTLDDMYYLGYGLIIGASIPWIFLTILSLRSFGISRIIYKSLTLLCLGLVSAGSLIINVKLYENTNNWKMWLAFCASIVFSIQTVILDFLYWGYYFVKTDITINVEY